MKGFEVEAAFVCFAKDPAMAIPGNDARPDKRKSLRFMFDLFRT
jgi:hypothetical protein